MRRPPRARLLLSALLATSLALAACNGDAAPGGTGGPTTATDPAAAAGTTAVAPGTTAVATTTAAAPTTSTTTSTTAVPGTTIPSPSGGVYPGADWQVAELPATVERAAVDAAVDAAFGAADASARVRSIVAVQGGRIVYERYHPLDGPDTVMESYSVAKSVTSAVIGLLVGDGLLDVDGPAPVEAWSSPDDPRGEITIEHLLHMASGLEWSERYDPGSAVFRMLGAEVASDFVASFPLVAEPGQQFQYSTGTTALLAGIITDTLGGVEATDEYLQERLFGPLGITSVRLVRDRSGRWFGGFGAEMTSRDFARFGLLYLNDGVWEGRRILPEGWVEYSRTPSPANAQYGAQWWMLRDEAFEARGLFGQYIVVSPFHDLVLVVNSTQGAASEPLVDAAYRAFTAAGG